MTWRPKLVDATSPTGGTTTYTYDAAGNQTRVTDPTGAVTTSVCDDANRLTRVIDPRGYSTTYD